MCAFGGVIFHCFGSFRWSGFNWKALQENVVCFGVGAVDQLFIVIFLGNFFWQEFEREVAADVIIKDLRSKNIITTN